MSETKGRRGPAPKISREAVLDAARELAPDEVTLAAIGARLGVTSPALYRYFEDRASILEALANEARERLTPPDPGLPWDQWLREAAQKERELWRAHPHLYEAANYRAISAPILTITAVGLRVLVDAGFTVAQALGALTITVEMAQSIGWAEGGGEQLYEVDAVLEAMPALLDIGLGPLPHDELFNLTLDIAIDGIRAQLPKNG